MGMLSDLFSIPGTWCSVWHREVSHRSLLNEGMNEHEGHEDEAERRGMASRKRVNLEFES